MASLDSSGPWAGAGLCSPIVPADHSSPSSHFPVPSAWFSSHFDCFRGLSERPGYGWRRTIAPQAQGHCGTGEQAVTHGLEERGSCLRVRRQPKDHLHCLGRLWASKLHFLLALCNLWRRAAQRQQLRAGSESWRCPQTSATKLIKL